MGGYAVHREGVGGVSLPTGGRGFGGPPPGTF